MGREEFQLKKNMGERDRKCNNTIPFNVLDQWSLKYFMWGRVQAISEIAPPPSNIKFILDKKNQFHLKLKKLTQFFFFIIIFDQINLNYFLIS